MLCALRTLIKHDTLLGDAVKTRIFRHGSSG